MPPGVSSAMRPLALLGLAGWIGALATGCERTAPTAASRQSLTLFAAASTTDVLTELAERFAQQRGVTVQTSYASSATLARQITAGAHADVFLSASTEWMDFLANEGSIRPDSRYDLLANQLVLIAPKTGPFRVELRPDCPIEQVLAGRLALGDPSHVPAGRYARQALEHLGWWRRLEDRILAAADVRAALRYVELGEAAAGIVYATDVAVAQNVTVVAEFPPALHDPIVYPVALGRDAGPAAAEFLVFLRSPEAGDVFRKAGFELISD